MKEKFSKRKLRKTSSNKQYKFTGNTPPIAAENQVPYQASQSQQGKGRIIDSSYLEIEIPPERRGIRNMFSGFTDEEIEKAMSEEFVNNVLEMFKTGEAVSPSTMKDTINEIVKQKDAEINELRAKLWQYESTFGSISPGDNKPPALHVDNSDKRNPDKWMPGFYFGWRGFNWRVTESWVKYYKFLYTHGLFWILCRCSHVVWFLV